MKGIGIQSKAVISEHALRVGYERVAKSGIQYIDYDLTWEDKKTVIDEQVYEAHRLEASKCGLNFSQVHAPRLISIELPLDLPDVIQQMRNSMRVCQILGSPYLVIHPLRREVHMSEDEARNLNLTYLEEVARVSLQYEITVCVENLQSKYAGKYVEGICSSADDLLACLQEVHRRIGTDCMGVCFDVGHANLLRKDIGREVRVLGKYLKVLHIHDNNGDTDDHQLPYSFSGVAHGRCTTDWGGFLLALREIGFQGVLSFEPYKALTSIPGSMQEILLTYLYEIACRFIRVIEFAEELESYRGKKIIIFGAGKMLDVYMRDFGECYMPDFVVDNNRTLWESHKQGLIVRNPKEIVNIPKDDRIVIICNMYFEQIIMQLEDMGIEEYTLSEEIYRMSGKPD